MIIVVLVACILSFYALMYNVSDGEPWGLVVATLVSICFIVALLKL